MVQDTVSAAASDAVARWTTRRIAICTAYGADDTEPEERAALMAELVELHRHEPHPRNPCPTITNES